MCNAHWDRLSIAVCDRQWLQKIAHDNSTYLMTEPRILCRLSDLNSLPLYSGMCGHLLNNGGDVPQIRKRLVSGEHNCAVVRILRLSDSNQLRLTNHEHEGLTNERILNQMALQVPRFVLNSQVSSIFWSRFCHLSAKSYSHESHRTKSVRTVCPWNSISVTRNLEICSVSDKIVVPVLIV